MSRLTIYFTADTHGYLYPGNFATGRRAPMGLLSMRFPRDENTLIIDGGDTIQGSPLVYFARVTGRELPIAQALNARHYDYITLGNHDFNFGREGIRKYLSGLNAKCLCANVRDEAGELPVFPGCVHVLGNGLRVGLIGIVTDWVNRWESPEHLKGLRVTDPLQAAREAVAALPPHDVLVGIYHGGIERDLQTGRLLSETDENIACRLCEELPFDLLLTGHQHIGMGSGEWNGVHLVQTPCNAVQYARVDLGEDGRFTSALYDVPDRADLTEEEQRLWEDVNVWLDHPAGHLPRDLRPDADRARMAMEGNSIVDLFNQVQLEASGADISCSFLGNTVRGFDRDVTVRDVVASYVYANTLAVLEVTGKVLRMALEQCATYFNRNADGSITVSEPFLLPKEAHFNYDYFAGIEYTFDLRNPPGRRVAEILRNGKPVRDTDRLKLCMCNYRATGSGDFEFYRSCPVVREIQTDMSELILNYLRAHDPVELPADHGIRVIL